MLLNPDHFLYYEPIGLYMYVPEQDLVYFYSFKFGKTIRFTEIPIMNTTSKNIHSKGKDVNEISFTGTTSGVMFGRNNKKLSISSEYLSDIFTKFYNETRLKHFTINDKNKVENKILKSKIDYIVGIKSTIKTIHDSKLEYRIIRINWEINEVVYFGDNEETIKIFDFTFPKPTCIYKQDKENIISIISGNAIKENNKYVNELYSNLREKGILNIHDFGEEKDMSKITLFSEAKRIGLVDSMDTFIKLLNCLNTSQFKQNWYTKAETIKEQYLFTSASDHDITKSSELDNSQDISKFFGINNDENGGIECYIYNITLNLPIQLNKDKKTIIIQDFGKLEKCGGSNCFIIHTDTDTDITYGIRFSKVLYTSNSIKLYNNIIDCIINLVVYYIFHIYLQRSNEDNENISHIHEISHFGLLKLDKKISGKLHHFYMSYTVSINDKNTINLMDYIEKNIVENTWTDEDVIKKFIYNLCINIMMFLFNAYLKLNLSHNDFKANNIVISNSKIYIIDFGESSIKFRYNNILYYLCKHNQYYEDYDNAKSADKKHNISIANTDKNNLIAYKWYTLYIAYKREVVDCDIYYILLSLHKIYSFYYYDKISIHTNSLETYKKCITDISNKFFILIFSKKDINMMIDHEQPKSLLYDFISYYKCNCPNLLLYRLYEFVNIISEYNKKYKTYLQKIKTHFRDYQIISESIESNIVQYMLSKKIDNFIFYNSKDIYVFSDSVKFKNNLPIPTIEKPTIEKPTIINPPIPTQTTVAAAPIPTLALATAAAAPTPVVAAAEPTHTNNPTQTSINFNSKQLTEGVIHAGSAAGGVRRTKYNKYRRHTKLHALLHIPLQYTRNIHKKRNKRNKRNTRIKNTK